MFQIYLAANLRIGELIKFFLKLVTVKHSGKMDKVKVYSKYDFLLISLSWKILYDFYKIRGLVLGLVST